MSPGDAIGVRARVPRRATPAPTRTATRRAAQCHLRRRAVGRRRTLPVRWLQGSAPGHGHGPGTEGVPWARVAHCAPSLEPTAGPHLIGPRCLHQEVALGEAPGTASSSPPFKWRRRGERPAVTRFVRPPAGQGLGRGAGLPSSGGGGPGHRKDTRALGVAAGALPAAGPGTGLEYWRPRGLARAAAAAATAQRRRAAPSMTAMAARSPRLNRSRV